MTLLQTWKRYPLEAFALAVGMMWLWVAHPANPATGIVAVLALLLCLVIGVARQHLTAKNHQEELELQADIVPTPDGVDIWSYQHHLMQISGQHQALTPQLNKTMLLYAAMQAEELAEQWAALSLAIAGALNKEYAGMAKDAPVPIHLRTLESIRTRLIASSGEMDDAYRYIKEQLTHMHDGVSYQIPTAFAVDILDGVTDVAVVTAGFSLAAGLPGSEAYLDVATSNISKANPATGLIERDPSGKWIKGRDYTPPNLAYVLRQASGLE